MRRRARVRGGGSSSQSRLVDTSNLAASDDTLDLEHPTVVAFFVTNQSEIDADTAGHVSEALGDFQFYISAIADSLTKHGVQLVVTSDSSIVARERDGRFRILNLVGPDSQLVGYWFFDPSMPPKNLVGGDRVDQDLLEQAAEYVPRWKARKP
jgi:hypothetical protein